MIIKFKEYDIVAQPAEVYELMQLAAGKEEVEEVKPEVEAAPAKPKQVRNRPKHYKKELDIGKMRALRQSGWSYGKIADELRCAESTVYNKLKEA